MEPDVYKLELHESTTIDRDRHDAIRVTRVPGGWIYRDWNVSEWSIGIFVPYVPKSRYNEE